MLEISFINLFRHGDLVKRTSVLEIIYDEEDDEMHDRLTAEPGEGRRHVRLAYETEIDSKKNSLKSSGGLDQYKKLLNLRVLGLKFGFEGTVGLLSGLLA